MATTQITVPRKIRGKSAKQFTLTSVYGSTTRQATGTDDFSSETVTGDVESTLKVLHYAFPNGTTYTITLQYDTTSEPVTLASGTAGASGVNGSCGSGQAMASATDGGQIVCTTTGSASGVKSFTTVLMEADTGI